MNGSYLLFLEIDGVETYIKARMSVVSSPSYSKGGYTTIRYSENCGNKASPKEYYEILDRLNDEVKNSNIKYNKDIFGKNEFSFHTGAINEGVYTSVTLLKEYDEVNRCFFQYETPAPIDKYVNNPNKELCHCGKRIATSFFHHWWCDECHKKQNWN